MYKPVVAIIMEMSAQVKTTWERKNEKKRARGGRKEKREVTHIHIH